MHDSGCEEDSWVMDRCRGDDCTRTMDANIVASHFQSAQKKSSRKVRGPRGAEDNALLFREPVGGLFDQVSTSL
ncbi:hypothetical protein CEE69_07450 [Rhodopirellula bahusiensis]|uniref:Uncharacterized protein n=1 Tax=Rhodopirellula bahusiensis TaxID=2014065 RepID=A0A2G1WBL3_9BACT|nr:hypothetical protein CEE69_07450 [Rhodopirellula bahusiensis]